MSLQNTRGKDLRGRRKSVEKWHCGSPKGRVLKKKLRRKQWVVPSASKRLFKIRRETWGWI